MKRASISYEFVEFIPAELEQGTLYVSIEYATAVHLCACGCRNKVVTPISPAEWKLIYDGDSVSLSPSIGNWQFPCRSHYWIRENQIKWAPAWSDWKISEGQRRDAEDLEAYFSGRLSDVSNVEPTPSAQNARVALFHRLPD